MPLRNNPLCHCKLPPVSLDCFVANAPRNDIRGVIASPFTYCHSDPDSECNEEEGEESHCSGQAPAWQSWA